MRTALRARSILMVLAGVVALLMKSWFAGSFGAIFHSYMGNVAASFAAYFVVSIAAGKRLKSWTIGAIALLGAELFEVTDGFKIMANVYDRFDYLANALGVALAYLVDIATTRVVQVNAENR